MKKVMRIVAASAASCLIWTSFFQDYQNMPEITATKPLLNVCDYDEDLVMHYTSQAGIMKGVFQWLQRRSILILYLNSFRCLKK